MTEKDFEELTKVGENSDKECREMMIKMFEFFMFGYESGLKEPNINTLAGKRMIHILKEATNKGGLNPEEYEEFRTLAMIFNKSNGKLNDELSFQKSE